ncbi:MAG: hypothetical protein M1823_003608 [Watsoniomyces obsoletus]|nr:MAG: hypothetical protein M1823_003608 [Watsoniomyces obsoletus]
MLLPSPLRWLLLAALAQAVTFDAVPPPNLDLSNLGRVGLVGDFDAISLYQYRQQSQNAFNTNGSQSILTPFPSGALATLASADAHIQTMCPFVMRGGRMAGVVVGGNFTSLGGVEAQGVAMFNPNTSTVTPLPGLSGKVAAALCDEATNTVYIGGEFKGANSTNAIAWVGQSGWTNLPFAGFNGPVQSIAKGPDGKIIFGGTFTGLGNDNTTGPAKKDQQVINLSTAEISAGGSSTRTGFENPRNVVCKSGSQQGANNTWLLADNAPGYWRAGFRFGFRPTLLRIRNTREEDRGTRTFRFTALPINGIMNLTYTDPVTKQNLTCDARCPLSDDTDLEFQDFRFVNVIGMSAFQIDVSEWYGQGGGLAGVELFQDDIYAFAVNDFNEPSCANIDGRSNATSVGPWSVVPSQQSSSDYLSGQFNNSNLGPATAVRFQPNLHESGNYSVTIYTPGCVQDGTCATRGRVNITGTMSAGTRPAPPIQTELFQTNNFDKYDQIYNGYIDLGGDFQPTVTLTPSLGQTDGNVTIVAQRVRFELLSSSIGLNGLYEFDPNRAEIDGDLSTSAVNRAGLNLSTGAMVNALVLRDGVTYVGGNFSSDDYDHIFAIRDNNSTSLPGGGLNGEVMAIHYEERRLYVGGNFTNTSRTNTAGLNNIAIYSISDRVWQPLGAGVKGRVETIVPISLNTTTNRPETVISLTGTFDELLPFNGQPAVPVTGFAVWVPSRSNWLQNLDLNIISIDGQLTTFANPPNGPLLLAGTLSSQGLRAQGAVSLSTSGPLNLNRVPVRLLPQLPSNANPGSRKRAISGTNVTGVVAGYFYEASGRNVTVLGGHFRARGSNGSTIENLAFVNGSDDNTVTGLSPGLAPESAFMTLAVHQDTLYAGGSVSGTVNSANVNGLILYDMIRADYVRPQPPAFGGRDVAVYAIARRPNTNDVYVGGNFESAGSLGCPGICIYTSSAAQWNRPASGLGGSVGALAWAGGDRLIVGGNLTVNGTATSMATYDARLRSWSSYAGVNDVPGPVTALSAADQDANRFWIAGASTNGSAFLMVYDGSRFRSVGDVLGRTTRIRGLQVLRLTQNHQRNDLLDEDKTVLITGQLDLPGFGNASAALFNGTNFTPFVLATGANNSPGSVSQFVSLKQDFFRDRGGHLAKGFVVLIALAIALALIFILVVIGIFAERIRRRREGYLPAPTNMFEKHGNMERIPPSHLFGTLGQQGQGHGQGPGGAPMI